MKLVFLDFDGVLNSTPFLVGPPRKPPLGISAIDGRAVRRLNTIVDLTGAKFVISSTWRIYEPVGRLIEWLEALGFEGEVIDRTPDFPGQERGVEILEWLKAYDKSPDGEDIEDFVILDDNADMYPLLDHLVQTDSEVGLTDADVRVAVEMLGVGA